VQVIDSDDAGEEVLPSPGGANTQPLVEVTPLGARSVTLHEAPGGRMRPRMRPWGRRVLAGAWAGPRRDPAIPRNPSGLFAVLIWRGGQVDTARMAPAKRAGYKRERFLKYNKKVLRFYATWDDRKVHAARSP